jgi:hypothetical protein
VIIERGHRGTALSTSFPEGLKLAKTVAAAQP